MASKRNGGKGNGETQLEMLGVLNAIHAELGQTNGRLAAVEQVLRGHGEQLRQLWGELKGLREETHHGFTGLSSRLENIRDLAGERYRELGDRVARLEAKVFEG